MFMKHRSGLDRSQTLMFPEGLEDYIGAENPVRFLDAFVGQLDLAAHPEKLKLRKLLCEHPFGTIKHFWATPISCSRDWSRCAVNGV